MEQQLPKITLNMDTNFLKLTAFICMVIDHFTKVFYPGNTVMLIIGRISFPIFAYCLVVGCLYTKSIEKYLIRLGLFAVISQPLYILYFCPTWDAFIKNIFNLNFLNILFTMFVGVMVIAGLMDIKKYWWHLCMGLSAVFTLNLDYGINGIILMSAFYLCRKNKMLSALVVGFLLFVPFIIGKNKAELFGLSVGMQGFAMLSMPLIYFNTRFNFNINKYIFYWIYPLHLLVLYAIRAAFNM